MKTFKVKLNSKQSIFDQVVLAANKAILSGAMKPGEPFPSVRALAADLKIHPNTAHKVVQHLIQERWLLSSPGKGTLVASVPKASTGDRKLLIQPDIKQLVAEARRVGVSLDEVKGLVDSEWKGLDKLKVVSGDH